MIGSSHVKYTHVTEAVVVIRGGSSTVRKESFSYQRKVEIRTIANESKPVLREKMESKSETLKQAVLTSQLAFISSHPEG